MGTYEFWVIHVVSGTRNACIVPPALPDKFKEVVHAREDVIHEDDSVKEFAVRVPKFVKWHECLIPDLREVLDTVVELPPRARRRTYGDSKPNGRGQCVEYAEECLCLVGRAVFVYGHVDIVVTQDSRYPEESGKEIRDDVE